MLIDITRHRLCYENLQCCVNGSLQGAGAALMGRMTRFEGIVRGMSAVLDCPLTVKMRTGIHKKNWNAHKIIPKLRDLGVSMVTVRYVYNSIKYVVCFVRMY